MPIGRHKLHLHERVAHSGHHDGVVLQDVLDLRVGHRLLLHGNADGQVGPRAVEPRLLACASPQRRHLHGRQRLLGLPLAVRVEGNLPKPERVVRLVHLDVVRRLVLDVHRDVAPEVHDGRLTEVPLAVVEFTSDLRHDILDPPVCAREQVIVYVRRHQADDVAGLVEPVEQGSGRQRTVDGAVVEHHLSVPEIEVGRRLVEAID